MTVILPGVTPTHWPRHSYFCEKNAKVTIVVKGYANNSSNITSCQYMVDLAKITGLLDGMVIHLAKIIGLLDGMVVSC